MSPNTLSRIWGSHGGEYEDGCLLQTRYLKLWLLFLKHTVDGLRRARCSEDQPMICSMPEVNLIDLYLIKMHTNWSLHFYKHKHYLVRGLLDKWLLHYGKKIRTHFSRPENKTSSYKFMQLCLLERYAVMWVNHIWESLCRRV
jgi:hypothetical protein